MVDTASITEASEPVYASVDGVPIPSGVAPGDHFTALVFGQRNGARVPLKKSFWRSSGCAPLIQAASVSEWQGSRQELRPSAMASAVASNQQNARAIHHVETQPSNVTQWVSSEELPVELNEADVGWQAGPVNGSAGRALPMFTGAPMGPRDSTLSSRSTARQIMRSAQFSRAFKTKVVLLTQRHQQRWASSHASLDSVERSFDASSMKGEHVELWYAVACRIAKLNPAIPAERLWDSKHHCHDPEVDAALSSIHWKWLNRHLSFGEYQPPSLFGRDDT